MRRLFQSLVDLFILCPIGHHKNIFASAFDFASHGYNMKPSPLPRFLVNVLKIPLPLLLILNSFQPLHLLLPCILRMQLVQDMNIMEHLFDRNAQQTLNVRTHIIRLPAYNIQHHENIIDISRELCKQLITIQKLRVLSLQLYPVCTDDHKNEYDAQCSENTTDQQNRTELKLIHIFIYNICRNDSDQHPVFDTGRLIEHVKVGSVQLQAHGPALTFFKIIGQSCKFLFGQLHMLPQEAKPIVNSILPFKPIIDHDTAVSMHHIAAGGPVIGKRVHFLHHTLIIIGKRDGIIRKSPVASMSPRTDKHEQLRLSGQHSLHNEVLIVFNRIRRTSLKPQIPGHSIRSDISAFPGEKVEPGITGLLLHLLQILLNVLILIYLLYRNRPHVQIGHVVLHKPVQHGTCLMQELSQMRNTLLVYCLRHQGIVAKTSCCDAQQHRDSQQHTSSSDHCMFVLIHCVRPSIHTKKPLFGHLPDLTPGNISK